MNNIIKTKELRKTLRFNLSECERLSGAISPFFFSSCACTPFWCAWCSTAVNARCFRQDKQDNLTRMHNKIRLIPHKTDLHLKANLHIEPASEEPFCTLILESAWVKLLVYFISEFGSPSRLRAVQKTQIANLFGTILLFLFNTSQGFSKNAQRRLTTPDVLFFSKKKKCSVLNVSAECSRSGTWGRAAPLRRYRLSRLLTSLQFTREWLRAALNQEPGDSSLICTCDVRVPNEEFETGELTSHNSSSVFTWSLSCLFSLTICK